LVLALLTAACISAAPPARETGDGAAAAPSPGPEPDLRQAQFFARTQGTAEQLELQAESFTAQIETGAQAIHTHLSITMKNPGNGRAMVAPSSFWDTSASILRERSDLPSRVAKVAEAVSAPKETRPALLAWWLVEHHLRPTTAPVAAYLVIANLLKEANSLDDAVRILSEVALFDPDLAAAELRRWGQLEDDAKRVEALKSRGER
jgi:hypothetical protein